MPRDSAGNYSLVSGNPVQSGEVISSSWANNTMDDLAVALSDSLDRNGRGGMLAPFRFADGTNLLPAAAWVNETSTGLYRFDGGDLRLAVLTQDVMRWQTSGVQIWDSTDMQWDNVLTDGGGGSQVPVNIGTVQGQTLRWDETTTQEWQATSALIVDDAGNVGIGTAAPQRRVHIVGPSGPVATLPTLGGVDALVIENDGNSNINIVSTLNGEIKFTENAAAGQFASITGITTDLALAFGVNSDERMRIDSAGNVGIGTAAPFSQLTLNAPQDTRNISFLLGSAVTGAEFGFLDWVGSTGDLGNEPSARINGRRDGSGAVGSIQFSTRRANNLCEEAMRIDSAGNVGIGTTAPGTLLDMRKDAASVVLNMVSSTTGTTSLWMGDTGSQGLSRVSHDNVDNAMYFSTLLVERMRIDSAGNVLVGATAPYNTGGSLHVFNAAPNSSAAGTFAVGDAGQTTANHMLHFRSGAVSGGAGTGQGAIAANGASSAAFVVFSDIALKENVESLPPQLANIMALRPVEFDYKDGSGHQIGFIAQEMETVYPDAVGGEEGTKSIGGWDKTTSRLVAAIQELTARLEALEA